MIGAEIKTSKLSNKEKVKMVYFFSRQLGVKGNVRCQSTGRNWGGYFFSSRLGVWGECQWGQELSPWQKKTSFGVFWAWETLLLGTDSQNNLHMLQSVPPLLPLQHQELLVRCTASRISISSLCRTRNYQQKLSHAHTNYSDTRGNVTLWTSGHSRSSNSLLRLLR